MKEHKKNTIEISDKVSSFLKGRQCLVTGAAGFIGSHVVEALVRAGASVQAMVHYNSFNSIGNLADIDPSLNRSVHIVHGDISDPFFVDSAVKGVEVVFHLAALIGIPYSYVAPHQYVTTNINGTMNILEASRKHSIEKVIVTSTSETYGTAQYVPQDENHPLQGQSPYSATKIGADKLAESYFLSFDLPVATIRPFNTYGPRQSARAIIPTIITQALSGPTIRVGSLSPQRDFNYVADTAYGFLAVAESGKTNGEVVNVGSGESISIGEVLERVQNIVGGSKEVVIDENRIRPEKSEVHRLQCDNAKIQRLTEWRPSVDIQQGLQLTVDWISANMDRYSTDEYVV